MRLEREEHDCEKIFREEVLRGRNAGGIPGENSKKIEPGQLFKLAGEKRGGKRGVDRRCYCELNGILGGCDGTLRRKESVYWVRRGGGSRT